MTDLFERASRAKFRFPSASGFLTVEQLWDLPLTSTRGASLDAVARDINAELKSITEDSFVEVKPDPRKGELAAQLEILKHIIGVKQAEAKAKADAATKAEKKRKLIDALARKQDAAVESMTEDEIRKAIEELDS